MITVNDKARDYILTKGGCIHILHSAGAAMCCGRINFEPSVLLGKPPHPKNYISLLINEITVYLPDNFCAPNALSITIGNFLWIKTLRIDGWKLL